MSFDAKTDTRATSILTTDVLVFGNVLADGWDTITVANFISSVITGSFQPLDSDLTAIAALTTAAFGRSLLTETSASSLLSTLGVAGANPSASVALTAVNGVATTFMRSDAAPALDQSIAPTWTGAHTFSIASASAVVVGPNGATNPTLKVVTNVASAATGLSITGNAAGSGVTLTALSSGSNESILMVSKGTGTFDFYHGANLNARINTTPALLLANGAGGTLTEVIRVSGGSPTFAAGGAGSTFGGDVYLPSTGNLFFNTKVGVSAPATNVFQIGSGSTAAGLCSSAKTPTQIAADQNNYSPGAGLFQHWSSDASRNVTGMVAGQDGETRYIWNVGAQNIVLQNENASSTAANRFTNSTGADITLAAAKCALAMYDGTSTRWRITLLP